MIVYVHNMPHLGTTRLLVLDQPLDLLLSRFNLKMCRNESLKLLEVLHHSLSIVTGERWRESGQNHPMFTMSHSLVVAALAAVGSTQRSVPTVKVWHLTDVHVDPFYVVCCMHAAPHEIPVHSACVNTHLAISLVKQA